MKKYLCLFISFSLFGSLPALAEEPPAPAEVSASTAQASQPVIPRSEPEIDQTIINSLIANAPLGTEVIQLDTGKADEKLIGFYQPEGSGIKQGGIIFFPDENTHLDWPGDLNNLRTGLTKYGWYTLAVYLPQPPQAEIPKRTLPVLTSLAPHANETSATPEDSAPEAAETPAPESTPAVAPESTENKPAAAEETNEPQEPYQDKVARLGQTALKHLQQQGVERFVVVGLGSGAVWAARYVDQFEESQDLRLVMIDPRQPSVADAPDLISLLPEIESTIIDLHHDQAIGADSRSPINAERRLRTARHNRMNHYHQSRLPASPDDWKKDKPWLLRQLRGLLNTYVIKAEKKARELEVKGTEPIEKAPGTMKGK